MPFVTNRNGAFRATLYHDTWSKTACVIFIEGALHSTSKKGFIWRSYISRSKRFFLKLILSTFSTLIRFFKWEYFSNKNKISNCLTVSSGVSMVSIFRTGSRTSILSGLFTVTNCGEYFSNPSSMFINEKLLVKSKEKIPDLNPPNKLEHKKGCSDLENYREVKVW